MIWPEKARLGVARGRDLTDTDRLAIGRSVCASQLGQ